MLYMLPISLSLCYNKSFQNVYKFKNMGTTLTNRHEVEIRGKIKSGPVSMAERSEARTDFGRSNTGIAGSNPNLGMDACPRFSVFCCPV
jgi:hypothetical protein